MWITCTKCAWRYFFSIEQPPFAVKEADNDPSLTGSVCRLCKAPHPTTQPFCFPSSGVNALIFVGLDRVSNFDRVMQLEFGRGFAYNRPLRVNLLDLDFELAEQLVSNLAQAALPCNAGAQPRAGSPAGLNHGWITPSWLCSSPLPTSRQLFSQMSQ